MKPVVATLASLVVLAAVSADAQQTPRTITITRRGAQATPAEQPTPSASGSGNFTGSVRVVPVFQASAPGRAYGSDVTFEPGARTAWHTHPAGQTLIVSAGVGRVQQWGAPIDEIRTGDVVRIPPGVKHWHGAAPNEGMTHLAISEPIDGRAVDWMEQVSDAQYREAVRPLESAAARPPRAAGDSASSGARPSVAPRAMTELAPKLADLTNRVLYGEVWPDSGLSQRDRSLVTVSALIAMNRPDQLRSHLARARANGVTKEEIAALITHLAFYAGWPSAVTAAEVANQVYQDR